MMAIITIMPGNDQGGSDMSQRLRTIGLLGAITLVALFALLPIASAAPRAATQNVTLKDNEFDPKTITVNVGDTVMWMDQGQNEHTVTADNGSFDSGDLKVGEKTSFSFTFSKAGTFAYHCKYHGGAGGQGMSGTVVVQAAGAPAAPAQMPRTGGEDAPLAVVVLAALVLLAGGWLALRLWRRSA
jgi:plastocyanin